MKETSFPARLHILVPKEGENAIVIRRGPSKQTCILSWNTRTDEMSVSQWLKGRIYERRSDASPDGKYWIYFAMNGRWSSKAKGSWSAIARAPWLKAIALIYLNLAVVTAVALFFSTYSSPMLSAVFTLGIYVVGQFNADLQHFDKIVNAPAAIAIAKACYYVLPDFAKFDVKLAVVHGLPVARTYIAATAAYAALYVAALLCGAIVIFSRRDFK